MSIVSTFFGLLAYDSIKPGDPNQLPSKTLETNRITSSFK
ncbi:hypothetical protein HMPREF9103_00488 [Lentilactobacillus parafarraginis F0439]|uniref:Uncharacterized protein n=1 Tax=Lentilactobacillus parafarraginis F0439 TaxID=797515 RepID=G9ZL90_9LACO|nr:hypothetical protein HMPREF9103_00488 [Lentilactobacillus parafarraginis F0439]